MSEPPGLTVVAAILEREDGRVLLAERPAGKADAGLWEFPGGKVEAGETAAQALARELHEELGIHIDHAVRLMSVHQPRATDSLELQAWRVIGYRGEVRPREQQQLRWLPPTGIEPAQLCAADRPIARTLQWPDQLLITPDPADLPRSTFLRRIDHAIADGLRLIRLRSKRALPDDLIDACERRLTAAGGCLLLGAADFPRRRANLSGLYLSSQQLDGSVPQPLDPETPVFASVHHARDIVCASAIGVDVLVIAPVLATASHPEAHTLGWDGFARLLAQSSLPAFALGGLQRAHLTPARSHGALGIAAIGGLWPPAD